MEIKDKRPEKEGDQLEREIAQRVEQEEDEKEKIEKQVREVIGKMGMQNFNHGFNLKNESPLTQHVISVNFTMNFIRINCT